ncbi:MAG: hypothetical protein PHW02_08680 [bacterium]|nr:hypothetical protein [bacterium]
MKETNESESNLNEFIEIESKRPDGRNRITLPQKVLKYWKKLGKTDSVQIKMNRKGEVLLKPTVSIPLDEMWVYENPEVYSKVKRGLKDAKSGKIKKAVDIEKFFNEL